ncbi:MAG: S49 family peptidase [Rhodobacteraceae bacterium]|nr:S49 family peptidase [Paracoccaceae bacterium]
MQSNFQKLARRLFNPPPVVSVLRLSGPVGMGGRFGGGFDDASMAPLIERAFRPSKLAAVALEINCPGGSPTQSGLISGRLRDAAEEKKVPIIAFCEDLAASGGYWLACAADEIFVEQSSIVGSIGVISATFGFTEALQKLGIERRVCTAGDNKHRLDPFQPEKPEDLVWLKGLQSQIHGSFINMVKGSRGDKLSAAQTPVSDTDLFSGEVWIGADAVQVGLADGVGRMRPTLKARYGEETRFNLVTPSKGLFSMLRGATSLSQEDQARAVAAGVLSELESRALWARYGL